VPTIISSIESEYRRYKGLAEAAIAQVSDAELTVPGAGGGNSIAVLCRHVGGNLRSRFTEFLTSDGEKPWRKREEEFQGRLVSREAMLEHWERGWAALFGALGELADADLERQVTIRGQPLRVVEALHRSLAHASYHVGQIVFLARGIRGDEWRFLSIAPGKSEEYNARPAMETPAAHLGSLGGGSRSA
jgi:hypothetical protein